MNEKWERYAAAHSIRFFLMCAVFPSVMVFGVVCLIEFALWQRTAHLFDILLIGILAAIPFTWIATLVIRESRRQANK